MAVRKVEAKVKVVASSGKNGMQPEGADEEELGQMEKIRCNGDMGTKKRTNTG